MTRPRRRGETCALATLTALLACGMSSVASADTGATGRDPVFNFSNASHMRGGEYRRLLRRTVGYCADSCAKEARCRGFSYHRLSGRCNLLTRTSPQHYARWSISGVRIQPHPKAQPEQVDGLTLEYGIERSGSGYHSLALDQPRDCASRCNAEPGCRAFRYTAQTRRCALLTGPGQRRARPGTVSGSKPGPGITVQAQSEDDGFVIQRNTAYFDSEYRHGIETDRSACQRSCAADPRCLSFTWQPFSYSCRMHATVSTARYRKGMISGLRQLNETPAPGRHNR